VQRSEGQEALRVDNLFCERGERILFQDLALVICQGEVIQVKGPNGSGKTTLLRIVCGLHDGYQGSITWCGETTREHPEDFLSSLTYLGHHVGVNKVLTPLENLRWSCGLRQETDDKDIYSALEDMGLKGFEESQCFTLSAGQQQRVSLSRLLLNQSNLWVLDEPFTTLDADGVKLLEGLLCKHIDRGGAALVTTHHNLGVPGLKVLELT
jgi:heme exporter protein A